MKRPSICHSQFRLCVAHRNVLSYVNDYPGCTKYDAARAGTWHLLRNPSKQYYLINTLIRQGFLDYEFCGNRYKLYITEDCEW